MYLRFRMLIFIVVLSGILHGCVASPNKDNSDSGIADPSAQNSSSVSYPNHPLPRSESGCDQTIASLECRDDAVTKDALMTVVANAQGDTRSYDEISSCLIDELRQLCIQDVMLSQDEDFSSEMDFYGIRNIGEAVAQLKVPGAIPILVDCSERRLPFGGLSHWNYPAIDPLLRFGDDAIPFLLKKYDDGDSQKKCRIAEIITMIRGPLASQTLLKLLDAEKDLKVRKCLTICLRSHSR